ncbi:hypothetical protein GRI39_07385 [Altererythrobacter indicus]|uniref:Uncharacterized protein n=2 Tax=Altericroceibacterium indicum TaxID=374177 RepID=A0A845A9C6_9SPHN|nr:hypothetical protein [Altericroceibacterium indicum]
MFASDAVWLAIWGSVCLFLALLAMLAEHRRNKRKSIDAVGWVPWTTVFVLLAFLGAGLLTLSAKALFGH